MVTLTKSEQVLYDYISSSRKDVPIADLVKLCYEGRPKPKHPKGSVSAMMRTLMLKAELIGLPQVSRTSRLGAGAPATYGIER
tara:strand:- start:5029 stop:5277 length:249 start_codon:yes stop_codon:yes gene_type:complete